MQYLPIFDTAINATASGVMSCNKTINNSSNTTVNYYISDVKIISDDDIREPSVQARI